MLSMQTIWEKSLEQLKKELTQLSYDQWIRDLKPISMEDDMLVLECANEFNRNTLRNLYSNVISNAINTANNTNLGVIFIDSSERDKYLKSTKSSGRQESVLNPRYTFDTFVIGNSNHFAYAASKAVAASPAKAYNPLFIYGGVGLGKTHLMHAIGHEVILSKPNAKIMYVTSETFTNELIQSIQDNKNVQFRNRYRNVDVLMVDDIQFIAGKDSTQQEFFHTFNALHNANKQIVISSDKPPREIPTLEERLRSRFEWGLIADIQPPDLETRIAILRKKATTENLNIPEDVLAFIAEKTNSNIRELEGYLTRVMAYATLIQKPINMELAETALKDILPGVTHRQITPDLIQQIVADYFAIDKEGLTAKRKDRQYAYPRQIAMYLCRRLTDFSLPSIGKLFGGRDHSTVMHACDKIATDSENNPQLKTTLDDIISRIRE